MPLIPIAVWGGQRLLAKQVKSRFRDRFGVPVHVSIGEPIPVAADDDARAVSRRLQSELQRLTDELQAGYPDDGAGEWWQPAEDGGTAPTPAGGAGAGCGAGRREGRARNLPPELSIRAARCVIDCEPSDTEVRRDTCSTC